MNLILGRYVWCRVTTNMNVSPPSSPQGRVCDVDAFSNSRAVPGQWASTSEAASSANTGIAPRPAAPPAQRNARQPAPVPTSWEALHYTFTQNTPTNMDHRLTGLETWIQEPDFSQNVWTYLKVMWKQETPYIARFVKDKLYRKQRQGELHWNCVLGNT